MLTIRHYIFDFLTLRQAFVRADTYHIQYNMGTTDRTVLCMLHALNAGNRLKPKELIFIHTWNCRSYEVPHLIDRRERFFNSFSLFTRNA